MHTTTARDATSLVLYQHLARRMNHLEEHFRLLGEADMTVAIVVKAPTYTFTVQLVFEELRCEGVDVVIHATEGQLEDMNDFVREMHTNSGLIAEIPNGIPMAAAEAKIIAYLESASTVAGKSPLAGNSVGVDRSFIDRDMPSLSAYLHYRTIDVSSIKELARRWYPKAYFNAPAKSGNHRALGDIQDSIAELAYYRSAIFTDASAQGSEDVK